MARRNNYSIPAALHESLEQRRIQAGRPGRTRGSACFGRYGARNLDTDDQAPLPLPSGGGGNGHIYAHNKQLALGATYTPSSRSLLEVRFGWSDTEGGKNPPALGSTAQDAYGLAGLPTDPRISGGLPSQSITGPRAFGRQATNPQWQYPSVWNPKINYTWLAGPALAQGRIRIPAHQRRSAGRESPLRAGQLRRGFTPSGRRGAATSTASRISCSGCGRSTR